MQRPSSPRSIRVALAIAILAALLGTASTALAGGKQGSDYPLLVQVAYGREVGPESLREQLEREVVRRISDEQCFAAVDNFDPEADPAQGGLLFRLVVQDVDDRTNWEVPLAYRERSGGMPDATQAQVTMLRAEIVLQLLTLPDFIPVRRNDFTTERGYRPQHEEDAKYEVRLLMLDHLAEEGRKFACKGSAKKLAREIERARSRTASDGAAAD
jgi:hypothetical protein